MTQHEKDALLDWLNGLYEEDMKDSYLNIFCGGRASAFETVICRVEEMPTEPRIVRCKECKYWHDDGIMTTCDKNVGNGFKADWYCADGEPKFDIPSRCESKEQLNG